MRMNIAWVVVCVAVAVTSAWGQEVGDLYGDGKIRLVVRADDFGFSHASNMALERLLKEGVMTSAGVIVNTGWLDETVGILKGHPEVSVGVHVCLNSEWVPYRWGPVLA